MRRKMDPVELQSSAIVFFTHQHGERLTRPVVSYGVTFPHGLVADAHDGLDERLLRQGLHKIVGNIRPRYLEAESWQMADPLAISSSPWTVGKLGWPYDRPVEPTALNNRLQFRGIFH